MNAITFLKSIKDPSQLARYVNSKYLTSQLNMCSCTTLVVVKLPSVFFIVFVFAPLSWLTELARHFQFQIATARLKVRQLASQVTFFLHIASCIHITVKQIQMIYLLFCQISIAKIQQLVLKNQSKCTYTVQHNNETCTIASAKKCFSISDLPSCPFQDVSNAYAIPC